MHVHLGECYILVDIYLLGAVIEWFVCTPLGFSCTFPIVINLEVRSGTSNEDPEQGTRIRNEEQGSGTRD